MSCIDCEDGPECADCLLKKLDAERARADAAEAKLKAIGRVLETPCDNVDCDYSYMCGSCRHDGEKIEAILKGGA